MHTIDSETLVRWSESLLRKVGAPLDIARRVATSLVESNVCGHDSHGVRRIPLYIRRIQKGQFDPQARPEVRLRHGSVAKVDGNGGFGQLGAELCCALAVELASEHGMATVALTNTQHIGRLGEYAEHLARQGFFVLILTTGGGGVAPYGGRRGIFGTNPMAWGIPTGDDEPPIVSDFSTSAAAEGKIAHILSKGERLRPGTILDRHGNPSTDPKDFYDGGTLLPFGGYKGYALSLVTQIAASMLTGNAADSNGRPASGNPTWMSVWSIDLFTDREAYYQQVRELTEAITSSEPAPGFDEVLLPGEPELRSRAERMTSGIPIPEPVWRDLEEVSQELNIDVPVVPRE